jgi:tetratricopeptide (TPR) repeat protein
VTGHPVYPFLESYVIDPERWPEQYRDRLRATQVPALSYRHFLLLRAQGRLGRNEAVRAANVAQVHGDWLYRDAAIALRETSEATNSAQFARRMLWVSPHAPAARAALIRHDPTVPAEWYRSQGDVPKWAAVLEAFLKTEDTGLDHARVRVELANYYLSKKEYHKAQDLAEKAAESGASPALQCAARCAEAMEQWPKAEAHVRRLSEQFPDHVGIWLLWCHRTGRGDATAAAKLVEETLSKVRGEPTPAELVTAAYYRALTGHAELAPELLLTAHRRQRNDAALLLGASLSDTLQDVAGRERLLNAMETGPYSAAKILLNSARNESEEFIPTAEAMDAAVKRSIPAARGLVCYTFGMFALRRGDQKRATEYLERAVAEADPKDTASAALAAAALRSMAKK